jgi:uncharacterized protein YkwD
MLMRPFALAAFVCVAGSLSLPAQAGDRDTERVHEVVALCNRQRARHELPPLKVNQALAAAALAHARDMAAKAYFDHTSPTGAGPDERCRRAGYADWTGENIYYGPIDARDVVRGWMESPGHRVNILSAGSREVGVAVARGRRGEPYWVQVFGGGGLAPDQAPDYLQVAGIRARFSGTLFVARAACSRFLRVLTGVRMVRPKR